MRRRHFEELAPVCPTCRRPEAAAPLAIAAVFAEAEDDIEQGILLCQNAACLREYPIIDGIPIIIREIRDYLARHQLAVFARDDLAAPLETLLGDGAGPGSHYDHQRQTLSTYAFSHFADLDEERADDPAAGSVVDVLEAALALGGEAPEGPALDAGCAVGRAALALAERRGGLVLGVDLGFAMLRLARAALRGRARYPLRREGLVYERRRLEGRFPGAERVDFWACDFERLPFADGAFALALALNTLDCSPSPLAHLAALTAVLAPGGALRLATPFDWSPATTPFEAWVGGHSQRSEAGGRGEAALRALIGAAPGLERLELLAERGDIRWRLRVHDRHAVEYRLHAIAARAC